MDNIRNNLLLDFYGDMLTEKQREVIRIYFECDSSLSEIAEELGMTRQAVYDNVKVSKNQLESFETKLKCVERFLANREKLIQISKDIEQLIEEEKSTQKTEKLQNIKKNIEKVAQNQ